MSSSRPDERHCPSLDEIASSQPIRFLVGPERQCYTIHGAIVGSLSRPLHAMVHGPWKGAEDSTITWDDVKTETFLALWQYAYTDCLEEPKLLPALIELSPNQDMEPCYHEVVDENYTFGAYDRCWHRVLHAIDVLILADKWDVGGLISLARRRLRRDLSDLDSWQLVKCATTLQKSLDQPIPECIRVELSLGLLSNEEYRFVFWQELSRDEQMVWVADQIACLTTFKEYLPPPVYVEAAKRMTRWQRQSPEGNMDEE